MIHHANIRWPSPRVHVFRPPAQSPPAGRPAAASLAHPLQRRLLAEVLLTITLPLALLAFTKIYVAGKFFWILYGLLATRLLCRGRPIELLAFTLALTPALNLFRDYAAYNIIIALFATVLAFHAFRAPATWGPTLQRYPIAAGIFAYALLYWAVSFRNTHEYATNLRLFELAFAVLAVLLLARHPVCLGAALLGLIATAIAVGAAMLPQHMGAATAGRLGLIMLDEVVLGNPVQLGLPLALGFLALVIDRGQWLNLQDRPRWRWAMLLPTLALLALTTSRAAWGVVMGGLLLGAIFGRRQRFRLLLVIAIGALGLQFILASPWGLPFRRGLERTFAPGRSALQRTSGRSDQWQVAWYAFTRSPRTILLGHGLGAGRDVYAAYSQEVAGIRYLAGRRAPLHSLFMQVMVEAGLLGLLCISAALLLILWKTCRWASGRRSLLPLLCAYGFIFVALTVTGNDTISGVFLGIGILATRRAPAVRLAPCAARNLHSDNPAPRPCLPRI